MKHGTGDGRGRHRNAGSPETRRWLELERQLDSVLHLKLQPTDPRVERTKPKPKPSLGPAPARPAYLTNEQYEAMLELRRTL